MVSASHKWTPEQRATWESAPEGISSAVAIRPPIGSVMLWRSSMLHAVGPHLSQVNAISSHQMIFQSVQMAFHDDHTAVVELLVLLCLAGCCRGSCLD